MVPYRDIEVSKELRQCGVTRLGRENTRISIEYQFQAHDGQEITRMIIFDLKPEGFFSTMEDFDKKARGGWGPNRRLPIPQDIIEKTKAVLANSPYYPRAFEYYDHDTITEEQPEEGQTLLSVGAPTVDAEVVAANEEEQRKREEAYASTISDPDFDNIKKKERLTPFQSPMLSEQILVDIVCSA
jgi:hypothetical protein